MRAEDVRADPRVQTAWTGVLDALRAYDAKVAEVFTDPRPVVVQEAPTAGELAAHLAAGGKIQRWHAWRDGGAWGMPVAGEEKVFSTCPPDQPQPGYRVKPDDG